MVSFEKSIYKYDSHLYIKIDHFMLGHGFNAEIVQNKSMAAHFNSSPSMDNVNSQQTLSNQSISSENSLGKRVNAIFRKKTYPYKIEFLIYLSFQTLTLEEKERMMRENDQIQPMTSQNERKKPTTSSSNVPLMTMTPISAPTTSDLSSAYYKDLTSTLSEQNSPLKPSYGMSNSQTMPSLVRPTTNNSLSTMQQQARRPIQNFSSSSNTVDLTSSLINNINSLGSKPQITPVTIPLNAMTDNSNSFISASHTNSGLTSGNTGLFQSLPSSQQSNSNSIKIANVTSSKTAAAEIDDLFN